jgi:hypothetical protein
MSNPPGDITSAKPAAPKESGPHVGLFYVVAWKLYWEGMPAAQSDGAYFKSYPKTYYTYWKNTVTRNHPELREYDFRRFPRGRVVFDSKEDSFVIMADKCVVENPDLIKKIVSEMRLPEDEVIVSVDKDCECADCEKTARQIASIERDERFDRSFKATKDGKKVFLGISTQAYVIPSDQEYVRLRKSLLNWLVVLAVALNGIMFYAIETIDDGLVACAVGVFSMILAGIVWGKFQTAWLRKRIQGWEKADGKG